LVSCLMLIVSERLGVSIVTEMRCCILSIPVDTYGENRGVSA
jgi:hypothetical protein